VFPEAATKPYWTKHCSSCNLDLPFSAFKRNARAPDGRQWWCHECKKQWQNTSLIDLVPRQAFKPPRPDMRAYDLTCLVCGRTALTRWTPRHALLEQQAGRFHCATCHGFIVINEAAL
jgi:hypothetical protein